MNVIIEKTYEFIDNLDRSSLIKELRYYKKKVSSNNELLMLINDYNNSIEANKVNIKSELYKNADYFNYISRYNELSLLVFKINGKYKQMLNSKNCKNS